VNSTILAVTQRIINRSKASREAYLQKIEHAMLKKVTRASLPCSNLAHDDPCCYRTKPSSE